MGNYFAAKADLSVGMSEGFPFVPVDPDRVGDVYLLAYSVGLESFEEAEKKRAHWSVIFDVAGESTDAVVAGLEVHFQVNFATRLVRVVYGHFKRPLSSEKLMWVRNLGRFSSPEALPPREWAFAIQELIDRVWSPSFSQANGTNWNSACNCQQFCRYMIQQLPLPWPSDLTAVGDKVPVIIDVALLLISSSQSAGLIH